MIWINNHLPILQIILTLFGALFATLSFSRKIAELIAIFTITCCFCISTYLFHNLEEIKYSLGDWSAPIGIELRLDFINSPLFIFINGALLFLLVFCRNLIKTAIHKYIEVSRQHLFYSIILFAHTGFLGMISTNDLFNFYVFIEISSLSAYVLMAQGNNLYAARGAFDYLIIGSIGATLILIGIGFLLGLTGSLNITDIKERFVGVYESKILVTASCFIIIGIFLKMAFFPLHFWMVRAYNSAPSVILVYLASISGVIGVYSYLRFTHFVLDYDVAQIGLGTIFKPLALLTIIVCGYFALKVSSFKKTIIYSSASHTGYLIFLLTAENCNILIFQFLALDLINKISLFLICAKFDENNEKLNGFESWFIIITLICSAGLPLSGMFILKVNILEWLFAGGYQIEAIIIVMASAIALLYHFKMAKVLLLNKDNAHTERFTFNFESIGMVCLVVLQIYMLSSQSWMNKYLIWDPVFFNSSGRTSHE